MDELGDEMVNVRFAGQFHSHLHVVVGVDKVLLEMAKGSGSCHKNSVNFTRLTYRKNETREASETAAKAI